MSRFPAISEPQPTIESMHNTILELKQAIEVLTRQRRPLDGAVVWQDLVELELIEAVQVPKR